MAEQNVSGPFPDPPLPDFDADGRPVPPWVKYPNLRRGSMGWRMGAGEHFLLRVFAPWWRQLPEPDRVVYRAAYQEPAEWQDFLNSKVPDFDSGGRVVPPWVKFPRRQRNSSAWRISRYKRFLDRFWVWWDTVPEAGQDEYRSLYPEPEEWRGFLSSRQTTKGDTARCEDSKG
jgi:hypothetical protein